MRSADRTPGSSRFLGVRLTSDEEGKLEEFRRAHGLANRSEAVRALVRGVQGEGPGAVDLPVATSAEILELVEFGYARSWPEALNLVVGIGLAEFARQHTERWKEVRSHARALVERRRGRERADREGRGLLRR